MIYVSLFSFVINDSCLSKVCIFLSVLASLVLAAPQNAIPLEDAHFYNGDHTREPYFGIEEVTCALKYLNVSLSLSLLSCMNNISLK